MAGGTEGEREVMDYHAMFLGFLLGFSVTSLFLALIATVVWALNKVLSGRW